MLEYLSLGGSRRAFSSVAASFSGLKVPPHIVSSLTKHGITAPSKVQQQAIANILNSDKHVLIQSETGSGKTLSYLIPLAMKKPSYYQLALVVVPTRELALQTMIELKKVDGNAKALLLVSGTDDELEHERQLQTQKDVAFVIGTPRRLLELKNEFYARVRYVVLDEVDKLLDPLSPYATERKKTMRLAHPKPTSELLDTICFNGFGRSQTETPVPVRPVQITALSASLNASVRRSLHTQGWVREALQVRDQSFLIPPSIKHSYILCTEETVLAVLGACIHALSVTSAFVFVPPTVRLAEVISRLSKINVSAQAASDHVNGLPAARMMDERQRLMEWLQGGAVGSPRVIVATTEAIRGLDLSGVAFAFLVGVAKDSVQYQHVAGRVGRMGQPGHAITLVFNENEEKRHVECLRRLAIEPVKEQSVSITEGGEVILGVDDTVADAATTTTVYPQPAGDSKSLSQANTTTAAT